MMTLVVHILNVRFREYPGGGIQQEAGFKKTESGGSQKSESVAQQSWFTPSAEDEIAKEECRKPPPPRKHTCFKWLEKYVKIT